MDTTNNKRKSKKKKKKMSTVDDYLRFRQRLSNFGSFFGPSPGDVPERVRNEVSSWSLPEKSIPAGLKKPIPSEDKKFPAKKKSEEIKNSRDYPVVLSVDPIPLPEAPEPVESPEKDNASDLPAVSTNPAKSQPLPEFPELVKSPEKNNASDLPAVPTNSEKSQPFKKNPLSVFHTKRNVVPELRKNSKVSDYSFLSSDQPNVIAPKKSSANIGSLSHLRKETKAVPRKLPSAVDVKRTRVHAREEEEDEPRPRKKVAVVRRRDDDYGEVSKERSMIRKMFGYNPDKYRDDDRDDRNMVAGFSDIQKEENRSARIGRKMDAEELRKNEEERKERLKKKKQAAGKPSFFE